MVVDYLVTKGCWLVDQVLSNMGAMLGQWHDRVGQTTLLAEGTVKVCSASRETYSVPRFAPLFQSSQEATVQWGGARLFANKGNKIGSTCKLHCSRIPRNI